MLESNEITQAEVHDPSFTPFTQIPNWLIGLLDPFELMVVLILRSHLSPGKSSAFPSVPSMARRGNMSERKVRHCINSLEEKGALTRERRFRADGSSSSNLYVLNWLPPVVATRLGGVHEVQGGVH